MVLGGAGLLGGVLLGEALEGHEDRESYQDGKPYPLSSGIHFQTPHYVVQVSKMVQTLMVVVEIGNV